MCNNMMPGRIGNLPLVPENPLGLSWHDSAWIPMLTPANIMEYFSERSNPFYDRTCNNEVVKMQRLSMDQLQNMTGLEYILLHVQDPILYVIRKQHRMSPSHATPLADYYIIAGIVYQAPDLASVLNSRILSAVHHLQCAFEETMLYSRYHPSKGYWWDFKANKPGVNPFNQPVAAPREAPAAPKEEPSTVFQRQRVDMLLGELVRQFPPPAAPVVVPTTTTQSNGSAPLPVKSEPGVEPLPLAAPVKREPGTAPPQPPGPPAHLSNGADVNMKPPPEKKPRLP